MAYALPNPPVLEKVRAHDTAALAARHPKAVGNDLADHFAKRAAEEAGHPIWAPALGSFGDPVQLPATVISARALAAGYDGSLFRRLQAAGHPVQVGS